MDRDAIENTVILVISTVLKTTFDKSLDVSRKNMSNWDSLKHMEIIFALEEEFGLEFTEAEISLLDSATKIISSIEEKHAS